MLLSVVIPVYNEKGTLFEIIRRVLDSPVEMERELVLVDDCSTDGTLDLYPLLGAKFPNANIRVFKHEVNQGKGAALRTGYEQVAGDIVIVQDADLEYDPRQYPKLLRPILDGRADVVYGSRFVGGDEHRVLYFLHSVGNRFLTLMSNMFTNLNLTDMETEVTAKVARGGWRIYEVGISYSGRSYEEGKKITWKDGVQAAYCIIRYALAD